MSAFLGGVARLGPGRASILGTLEPPIACLLAFLVFGERLAPLQLVGGALVASARRWCCSCGASTIARRDAPARPTAPAAARALRARRCRTATGWAYEPKWDGFRAHRVRRRRRGRAAVARRETARPLLPRARASRAGRYVLDGEIVIATATAPQDFDALQHRIHPAASRIERLAARDAGALRRVRPARRGDESLLELPFAERRAALEAFVAGARGRPDAVVRAPAEADGWLRSAEGVIAKELAAPYRPGERDGMVKVKRVRTIDASWWAGGRARRSARSAR